MPPIPKPPTAPAPSTTIPVELLAVMVLLILSGGFLVVIALQAVPDVLEGFSQSGSFGELSRALAALVFVVVVYTAGIGAALLVLAFQLSKADRVARVLSVALALVATFALLATDGRGTGENVALACAIGVVAVLSLSPNTRTFFTGPNALQHSHPEPIVAARSLLLPLFALQGLNGVAFLPIAELDGKFALIGLLLIAISVAGYHYSKQLAVGDSQARAIISIGMLLYAGIAVWSDLQGLGLVVPLGLAVTVAILLWIPESAQRHFA